MGNPKQNTLQLIFLISILCLAQICWSQTVTDSLKTELEQASGTHRVELLNQLSHELKHVNPKQALAYAKEAISLAKAISFRKGEASAYLKSGNALRKLGNFNHALDAYQKALKISEEDKNRGGIARSHNGLGIAYCLLAYYDKSIESFFSALKTYEEDGDKSGVAHALNNIGINYYYLDKHNKALEYYLKALVLRKEIGSKADIAASLNNIGDIYSTMGNWEKALQYLLEALNLHKEFGNNDLVFALHLNIGNVYGNLNDDTKALEYFRKGLAVAEKIGDSWGMAKTFNHIGTSYLNTNNYQEAEHYFSQSLEIAKEIEAKALQKECYDNFSKLYLAKTDYKKSLDYYKLYSEVKDSIFNEKASQQMAEMQTRYETEKKEAAIIQLTNEKAIQDLKLKKSDNLKWSFIVVSFLTLLLAGFIFYGFRQKQKANTWLKERNKLEIENKKRAISMFGQQVSKEVALELLSDSFKSSSKKIFACIMFLDIRDFTPFAEHKEPSEIIRYQNDVFGFMIDIISKHHGIINQFLGDGFMATFGAPASSGNDSQNAVSASIEIVELLNLKCESMEIPKTKVGIGLHAGHIVTGNVGTAERKQYSITGNTVILASRIEQLNKKFNSELLISKEVLEQLDENKLKMTKLGPVHLKGRAEPMEIIRLI